MTQTTAEEYTTDYVANLLHVSAKNVRDLIRRGLLKARNASTGATRYYWLIDGESLRAYLTERQIPFTIRHDPDGDRVVASLLTRAVYTAGQVAIVCKVSARTVSKWFDEGKLKGYRIPGSLTRRIPRAALLEFLHEHNMPYAREICNAVPILLVGLDPHFTARLLPLLPAEAGYAVTTAATAFDAGLQAPGKSVVIIDLRIGRGEALAMAASLRNGSQGVLYLGALLCEDDQDTASVAAAGYDCWVRQPCAVEKVVEMVKGGVRL